MVLSSTRSFNASTGLHNLAWMTCSSRALFASSFNRSLHLLKQLLNLSDKNRRPNREQNKSLTELVLVNGTPHITKQHCQHSHQLPSYQGVQQALLSPGASGSRFRRALTCIFKLALWSAHGWNTEVSDLRTYQLKHVFANCMKLLYLFVTKILT